MPRDNDNEFNKLESELAKLKSEAKNARANAETEEDREEIDVAVKTATKAKREIKGASEASVHAALEEIRALRSELADKYNILPASPKDTTPTVPGDKDKKPKDAAKKDWSLSDLFF